MNMADDIIISYGKSSNEDSFVAGEEAITKCLEKFGAKNKPNILFVFASSRYNHDDMLSGISQHAKNIPIIGGTSGGIIFPEGIVEKSACVIALSSKKIRLFTAISKNANANPQKAGSELAESLLGKSGAQ